MAGPLQTEIRTLLRRGGLRPRKRLSQNFLADDAVFDRILFSVNVKPKDQVLEIGAGPGILTEALSQRSGKVAALEIDPHWCEILRKKFARSPNVSVVCGDVLKFKPDEHFEKEKITAVGNIPYHISGSILRWILNNKSRFKEIYLTVQKEVAERIVSRPRSKNYGVLSILCQQSAEAEILFIIPKEAFWPCPKVESAFVKLTPHAGNRDSPRYFIPLVKQAFGHRRKTLLNNLKSWPVLPPEKWAKILASAGIAGKERAEELSVKTFERLAEILEGAVRQSGK